MCLGQSGRGKVDTRGKVDRWAHDACGGVDEDDDNAFICDLCTGALEDHVWGHCLSNDLPFLGYFGRHVNDN